MSMVAGACSFGGHAALPVTQGTTCRIYGTEEWNRRHGRRTIPREVKRSRNT